MCSRIRPRHELVFDHGSRRDRDQHVVRWCFGPRHRRGNPGWVSVRARALGLEPRSPRVSAGEKAAWRAAYENGSTVADLARESGRYPATISNALTEAGIHVVSGAERVRRWPVRHDAFSPPLTTEAWYWIGFLAADGYVRRSRVCLGLKPSSAPSLRRFMEFVGSPERPLRITAAGNQLAAEVSSAQIVRDLAQHGLLPAKTLSLTIRRLAAAQPAFWLGYLDGDGCVCISRRNGVPTIHLVGTRAVMEDASAFIASVVPDRRPSVHRHSSGGVLWIVRASGHTAREVARALLAPHAPSLEPKRERLEVASTYESRVTRAKAAVRRRRCALCGAAVERMPSQLTTTHVFCTRDHYREWRSGARRGTNLRNEGTAS
jgi:hypothetical protein